MGQLGLLPAATVLRASDGLEMVGVHAGAIAAEVVEFEARWHLPIRPLPRNAVGKLVPEHPVSLAVQSTDPQVAAGHIIREPSTGKDTSLESGAVSLDKTHGAVTLNGSVFTAATGAKVGFGNRTASTKVVPSYKTLRFAFPPIPALARISGARCSFSTAALAQFRIHAHAASRLEVVNGGRERHGSRPPNPTRRTVHA